MPNELILFLSPISILSVYMHFELIWKFFLSSLEKGIQTAKWINQRDETSAHEANAIYRKAIFDNRTAYHTHRSSPSRPVQRSVQCELNSFAKSLCLSFCFIYLFLVKFFIFVFHHLLSLVDPSRSIAYSFSRPLSLFLNL